MRTNSRLQLPPAGLLRLTAAHNNHRDRLTAAAVRVETVDTAARRVSGLVLPYGEVGWTSVGPMVVPGPGRISIPTEVDRVKLVDEHQDPPVSVGYAAVIRDTLTGLRAEFVLSPTEAGDRVLAELTPDANGGRARDGFSVELVDLDVDDSHDPPHLNAGALSLVAAVTAPAWDNARVDGLAASRSNRNQEGKPMTVEQRARLADLLAIRAEDRTEEQSTELRELLDLANAAAGVSDDDQADDDQADQADDDQQARSTAAASRRRAARVPTGTRTARRRGRPIRELFAAQARVMRGDSRPELEAALADITGTANIWTARDDYAGQLWSGLEYERQYVGLMLPGPLPSYKGTGWKWTTKPEVGDYAGDKAAVPSNSPVTVATSWQAARLAGAHDLDRKFFDFGDQEFIEAYYAAMRESYAKQSDGKARAWILANAVAAGAAGTTIWHAAAKASQAVYDATGGVLPDYFLVNSADVFGLVGTPSSEMPDQAVLDMFGVTSDKFKITPGVTAGTVVAGTRQAGRFRELSETPIRVEAINLANGGVDSGVFGYYATEETFEGGIQSATFVAA